MITSSCETNRGQLIPFVTVNRYLFLYSDLANMGIGTTKLIPNEGVNGIVLYREADLVFYAYDRTCTLWPEHDAAVVEDSVFFGVFRCPECGSTYLLMNGGEPNSGPARYPLVQYKTSVSGDVLHIYN
jgi:Rieske Fe-S protein